MKHRAIKDASSYAWLKVITWGRSRGSSARGQLAERVYDLALGSKRLLLLTDQCENEALLQYNQNENIQVTITQVVLHSKRNNQQMKMQTTEWEKAFSSDISDKKLTSKI